jgi:hypothetical protein
VLITIKCLLSVGKTTQLMHHGLMIFPQKNIPHVGQLKAEDNEVIKLVDTYTDDNTVGGVMVILKSCITEMYEIEVKN